MRRQCTDLPEIQLPETIIHDGSAGFPGKAAAPVRQGGQITELRQTGTGRSGGNSILFRQKTETRTADDRSAFLQAESPAAEAVEPVIAVNIGLQPCIRVCSTAEDRPQKTGGFAVPAKGGQDISLSPAEFADGQAFAA